ncbi:hypothetical protein J2Z79_001542 [Symbiobacterium terraclitae]|uniref:SnoaL-like domain-containing protein n=1 Tax=Symbiobacterium terraclitae TaxID=557451 RepID=A0ABS4JRI6_9FIRM|nr:hypothetical protein [Symbiobacterium terraclitae]MBP2018143.1 hypothetical protein [Symbiobacterium terraclitae]
MHQAAADKEQARGAEDAADQGIGPARAANRVHETDAPGASAHRQKTGDEEAARAVVEEFGRRLKMIPLLAPPEVLGTSMREEYGDLVSPELLERWQQDPANAPGRTVSSPWPDRIEIVTVTRRADDSFEVQGEIILKTSQDTEQGFSAKRAITLVVTRTGDRWLITEVTLGDYVAPGPVTYINGEYGFVFSLPESWQGYTIVTDTWEGLPVGGSEPVETGPLLRIRHPGWRAEAPRQDIPIMVFTLSQWEALQAGEFHIGAAPIGPTELGRNDEYVFALPARYNYAFPEGYEEVEEILAGSPLQPRKPVPAPRP